MLALVERLPLRYALIRHPAISISVRTLGDRVSDAYRSSGFMDPQADVKESGGEAINESQPRSDVKMSSGHTTRAAFDSQQKTQRYRSADEETGVEPTKWQRRFLVITKLYDKRSDIPQYVGSGTMSRMHDRMRVLFIVVGVTVFFILFFIAEAANAKRITRDRIAGIVVDKM